MNELNSFPIVILVIPIGIIALWIAMLYLFSRLGGWHRLAEAYPDRAPSLLKNRRRAGLLSARRRRQARRAVLR